MQIKSVNLRRYVWKRRPVKAGSTPCLRPDQCSPKHTGASISIENLVRLYGRDNLVCERFMILDLTHTGRNKLASASIESERHTYIHTIPQNLVKAYSCSVNGNRGCREYEAMRQ